MRWKVFAGLLFLVLGVSTSASCATLTIALASAVTSLDPHHRLQLPNASLSEHIFDKLIHANARQQFTPGLAESWHATDERTWVFKLRAGVKFHDGSDFTADDVVFSLARPQWVFAKTQAGDYVSFTRAIADAVAVDRHTVRIRTKQPYPTLPADLNTVAIVSSRHAREAHTVDFDNGKAAIGTGPYKLGAFVRHDNRIELVRNDDYWGAKAPFERVVFRVVTNDATRVADLLSGTVQMIESVPTTLYARVRDDPNTNIARAESNRMIHFHLDSAREVTPYAFDKRTGARLASNPFKDLRVRQAFSKAIDRRAIVLSAMDGFAEAAGQLMPDGFFGAVPGLGPEKFDPGGARRLLAEAGYPDGFALTLHAPRGRYVNDERVALAVAGMLTRVGIRTTVTAEPWSKYSEDIKKRPYSAALLGWGVSTGEATFPLRYLVGSVNAEKGWGAYNLGGYSNSGVDSLLDQALNTIDDAKRSRLLQQATETVIKDYGIIPVHFQVNLWGLRKPLVYDARTDERTYAHAVRLR